VISNNKLFSLLSLSFFLVFVFVAVNANWLSASPLRFFSLQAKVPFSVAENDDFHPKRRIQLRIKSSRCKWNDVPFGSPAKVHNTGTIRGRWSE